MPLVFAVEAPSFSIQFLLFCHCHIVDGSGGDYVDIHGVVMLVWSGIFLSLVASKDLHPLAFISLVYRTHCVLHFNPQCMLLSHGMFPFIKCHGSWEDSLKDCPTKWVCKASVE